MIGLHILLVGNTMERRPCAQVTRTAEKSSLCACVSITYEEVSWYTLALRRSFRRTVLSGKAVRGINAIFDEHRFCYPVPPRCRQPEAYISYMVFLFLFVPSKCQTRWTVLKQFSSLYPGA